MTVYHVTSYKKLQKYIKTGYIKPPVRAWIDIKQAKRMSKSTGRKIILRLNLKEFEKLEGHFDKAVYTNNPYVLDSI